MTDARLRGLTLALIVCVGGFAVLRLELTNSITHFIPEEAEAELVQLSLDLVESPLSRRMVLAIEGGPTSHAVATDLAEVLASRPEVAWIESGLDETALRGIFELYFDRRFYLASDDPAVEIPRLTSTESLRARARDTKHRLVGPDRVLITRTVGADPLGLAERMLARIEASRPELHDVGGEGADFATIQLGLADSPFDSKRQAPFLEFIETEFARIVSVHGGSLHLDQDGVNRFAVAAERSVRGDVNLISSVSMIVVVGLFLAVFRSLRQLGIAFLVPFGGFCFAMAVAVFAGEPVHGVTLGFGFALIGVAIDYPIHLMNHQSLASGDRDARVIRDRLRNSLLLSGATTSLAFGSLAASDFPGLADMGRFGAVGILVAVALTLFCLPAFLARPREASGVQRRLASGFERVVDRLSANRVLALVLVACFAGLGAIGWPRLVWEDDPGGLMATDPGLLAEADRVRSRVADFDGARFVVSVGRDEQTALETNSEVARHLVGSIESGDLEGIGSLHTFLWPVSLQRANQAALAREEGLAERVVEAFAAEGFRADAFREFERALEAPRVEPVRVADLEASPLARVLDSMVELDGRVAIVTFLRGVARGEAIERALRGIEGVHYVDQARIVSELYQGYRESTIRRVALGALIVFGVLLIRYRNFVRALLAFLPAGLSVTCTLGTFGLLGIPVNVASAVSLLVILGMGVDYGIFAVDSARRGGREGATLSSLLVSCVTSIFVFGVLALSEQPVLRSIGLTTGVGVLFALLFSPSAVALARARERAGVGA